MIGSFAFNTSARILFENGAASRISTSGAPFLGSRPFIITDKGIIAAGLLEATIADLCEGGHSLELFTAVTADPALALVDQAVEAARHHGATSIIGFGGGSSLDVAKLVALLLGSDEDLNEAWG
ncbi:MAG: iron-containing alcohol dehydrogenase, partial [Roseibium sp.]|uniref:iron-containing alcohol dehydrogenase n=1 Tax=Roseibium sp. TaxID=1936156 RepID=UPI0032991DA6